MQDLMRALASIRGVVAIGLGGSRGLGIANEQSDYDIVLFRNGGERIATPILKNAITPFTNTQDQIQEESGFVSAQISGRKIELFQKDLHFVEKEINQAKSGKFNWAVRHLFPHGDLSTCIISHIMYLELIHEKAQSLSNMRRLAEPFPILLMNSLTSNFLTQSYITLIHAKKIKNIDDIQYLIALCSAFVFFANIVIFAINRKYPVLERGGAKIINSLPRRPENYEYRIPTIFKAVTDGNFGVATSGLSALHHELKTIAAESLST